MIILQKFNNLVQLFTYFNNEQVCREYLEQIRWNGNITCPYEDLEYKPSTIHKLKYLYHIKRVGGGLKFTHMGYIKLNFWQHFVVMFSNRLLPWLSKFNNLLKIITITTAIATSIIGYKQIELSNKVQKIEIINTKK
jgi:hypothetical protein